MKDPRRDYEGWPDEDESDTVDAWADAGFVIYDDMEDYLDDEDDALDRP